MNRIIQNISMLLLLLIPLSGSGVELGTRQRTIMPFNIPPGTPGIAPSNVSAYVSSGYGQWNWGSGTNEGRKFLTASDGTGVTHVARLLSFFSISDIHITDKESPAQVPYMGWSAAFGEPGLAALNKSAYSPVCLSTLHQLDAAIRTVNALHRLTPFDFGISLGDVCNNSQYNELRWFLDVMDGGTIRPSSGDHRGETNRIDYQMPFQAVGLDRSIPWYAVIGNHDQFWMGIGYPTEKVRQALVGSNVLEMATTGPLFAPGSEGRGMYVGTVDGATPFGTVIKWGATNLFEKPPTVVADPDRHTLATDVASPTNFINEFFNTASSPPGHGFNRAHTGSLAACYSFFPQTNLLIKMIVLDSTCKTNVPGENALFVGGGWVDAARYTWLTNELQHGQDANQLMIIACHTPIRPQTDLFNTNLLTGFAVSPDNSTEESLITTLHNYPNLLLLMAGHRHVNTVTPKPSPDPDRPEYGFWEVETPSLRDFPRQFRTWEILRNSDNTVSILTTDVDLVTETNSPAWTSIGYGIGTQRITGTIPSTNTISHTYNVELVKQLSPAMQAKIAGYGGPPGHRVTIDGGGTGMEVGFLGQLQAKHSLLDPAWIEVPNVTSSPYTVSAPSGAMFYRAYERSR